MNALAVELRVLAVFLTVVFVAMVYVALSTAYRNRRRK